MAGGVDQFELFNSKLREFISDMRPLIGTLPEYKLAMGAVQTVEPRKNQQMFDTFVAMPYEEHIVNKNAEFFMKDAALGGEGNGPLVALLRSLWTTKLSDADKDAVWQHLQVLVVLNRRCRAARATGAN